VTQVLARKWRPKTFSELVGQEHVVRALTNALGQQRLHHAYLFTGTRGVGKTTLARIMAKALNCGSGITAEPCCKCAPCVEIDAGRFVDLIELDAASNTQVDNMRDLLENALYAPTSARFKVYIIDEAHMLSRSAFNAMLKTLEEPPGHVKFILATTEPQKIPVTVLSRCLQFNLKQIPPSRIKAQLIKVLELEGVTGEEPALALLARAAHGSMRDGLSLLDQAIAHGGGRVEQQAVRAMLGSVGQDFLHDILSALQRRDGAAMVAVADRMAENSLSFEIALQELATLLLRISLMQTVPQAIAVDDPEHAAIEAYAAGLEADEVQLLYQIVLHGRQDIGLAPDEYAGFTMTLLRMLAFMPGGRPSQTAESAATAAASPQPTRLPRESKKKPADRDWNALVTALPLTGVERMLAQNCRLVAWQGERIELCVSHARRHLAERAYRDRLRLALEQHLGTGVRLEISIDPGAGNTPADIREQDDLQRRTEASAALDGDPFVRDLVENFDARVRSSTIKPAT